MRRHLKSMIKPKTAKDFYLEKLKKNGLVGNCFHSIDKDGKLQWQGRIISQPNKGIYLIQLYEWLMGEQTHRLLVKIEDMTNWIFYEDEESMRFSAEHGKASLLRNNKD